MIIEISSDGFDGFYHSRYCDDDDFYYDESIITKALRKKFRDNKIYVEYEYENFSEYTLDVGKSYIDCYMEKIIDVLPSEIIDKDTFLFEKIDNSVCVVSPKYYNYVTDKVYCNVKTNCDTLKNIFDYTLSLKGVKDYLIDNFSSYDGKTSSVSNQLDYWKNLDICNCDKLYWYCLFDMLLYLSDKDCFSDITDSVLDDICKYSYVICYVNWNDIKMELNDFCKKYDIDINSVIQ